MGGYPSQESLRVSACQQFGIQFSLWARCNNTICNLRDPQTQYSILALIFLLICLCLFLRSRLILTFLLRLTQFSLLPVVAHSLRSVREQRRKAF